METPVQHVQYLHHYAVIAGRRVQCLVNDIHSDSYDLKEVQHEAGLLVRFYGENARELKECVREVLVMSEVFTHLRQFEAWNARDVFALLQSLAGIICYRRNEDNIRQACQALIELPLMLSPKDLDHVVTRFHKFPEILAHRLGQVVTYECQMELLRASLNMGNTKNLITEERRNKLNLMNPGTITESNKLYTSITPDNHMKSTRAYLNHFNTSVVPNNGIQSMEGRILAINDVMTSDEGQSAFIDFNTHDSSISLHFPSELLLPRDPGSLLLEMKNCYMSVVGDEGRSSILTSSSLWSVFSHGQDISKIFGDIALFTVQLYLPDMKAMKRSILSNFQGDEPMEVEFTFGTGITSWAANDHNSEISPGRTTAYSKPQPGPQTNTGTTTRLPHIGDANSVISVSSEGDLEEPSGDKIPPDNVHSQPRPGVGDESTHPQEFSGPDDDSDYEEDQASGSEQDDECDPESDSDHDWMDDGGGQASTSRAAPGGKKPLLGLKAALISVLRSLKSQGKPDPTKEQLVPLMTQVMKTTVSAMQITDMLKNVKSTDGGYLSLAMRFELLREKAKAPTDPGRREYRKRRYQEHIALGCCTYATCRLPRMPGYNKCEKHVADYRVWDKKNNEKRRTKVTPGWDELTKLYNKQRIYNTAPGEKNPISSYQDQVKQLTKDLLGKLGSKPTENIYQVYVGLTDHLPQRLQAHKSRKPYLDKNVSIVVPSALLAGFVENDCAFKLQAMFGVRCENNPARLGFFGKFAPTHKQFHVYILYNQE